MCIRDRQARAARMANKRVPRHTVQDVEKQEKAE